MQIDRKFFENIVSLLDTEHMILYQNQDKLDITEAWMAHVNRTLQQCKEINEVEKYNESVNSVVEFWDKSVGGEDFYNLQEREDFDSELNFDMNEDEF